MSRSSPALPRHGVRRNDPATHALGRLLREAQNAEISGSGWTDPAHHRIGVRYRFVVEVKLGI